MLKPGVMPDQAAAYGRQVNTSVLNGEISGHHRRTVTNGPGI
jgi:hypothetical protein